MSQKHKKPEWVPEDGGSEFASHVRKGVEGGHDGMPGQSKLQNNDVNPKKQLSIDDYINGVIEGNRTILARTITLVESNSQKHMVKAQEVLRALLPRTGKSIRLGITGSPGAGKSTFIEALGTYLCEKGHKVAVLAVDPSSTRTHGSILGDKTRMELLSRYENAFIRPSPSGGTLGGVARKTRETIMVCEAAGFDTIIIETVGIGQSETTVRSMVDFFLLLLLPGAGDELQGIKKGSVELADALVVNKAEGENFVRANMTRLSYKQAIHYLQPATEGWETDVFTCSALNNEGIDTIWSAIMDFVSKTQASGIFESRRREQVLEWVYSMVEDNLKQRFYSNPDVSALIPGIESSVLDGSMTPTTAVNELLRKFSF